MQRSSWILRTPIRLRESWDDLQPNESLREDYIARGLARAKLFSWDEASREEPGQVYRELLG